MKAQISNNELVREVEKAADVYARYYIQGTVQEPAASGCFESLHDLESDGARVTCSSATALSVSRRRHVCIAYWPVWCAIPPSVCRQHIWEVLIKGCAVVDGPVLGAL